MIARVVFLVAGALLASAAEPVPPQIKLPVGLTIEESSRLEITGIKVDDLDADSYFQHKVHVNLTVHSGVLKLADTSGVLRTGNLFGDKFLELFGSLSNVQHALSKVYYTPNKGFIGTDTFSLSVNDMHYSVGRMVIDHDPALSSVGIDVVAKKTPLRLLYPVRILGVEDIASSFDVSVEFPNYAVGNFGRVLTVRVSALQGVISTTDGGCNSVSDCIISATAEDINSALLGAVYTPPLNFNKLMGLDIITVSATDDEGTATSGEIRVVIDPVGDAPELLVALDDYNTGLRINEGSTRLLDFITVSDVDYFDKLTMQVTADDGYFTLLASLARLPKGLRVELQDDGKGVQLIGLASTITSFLGKVKFHPVNEHWYGNDAIHLVVTDSGDLTAATSVTVLVDPVDTPPFIKGAPGNTWGEEDKPVTIEGVTVGDIDLMLGAMLSLTLAAENGVISLALSEADTKDVKLNVKFLQGDGDKDRVISLLGTPDAINSVIERIVFNPDRDVNVLSMLGNSAKDATSANIKLAIYEYDVKSTEQLSETVYSSMQFLLKPVNDPPVLDIANNGVVIGYEDTVLPLGSIFSVSDVDCLTAEDLLELHLSTEKGVLSLPKPFGLELLHSTGKGIRVRGTPDSINAAVRDLVYR